MSNPVSNENVYDAIVGNDDSSIPPPPSSIPKQESVVTHADVDNILNTEPVGNTTDPADIAPSEEMRDSHVEVPTVQNEEDTTSSTEYQNTSIPSDTPVYTSGSVGRVDTIHQLPTDAKEGDTYIVGRMESDEAYCTKYLYTNGMMNRVEIIQSNSVNWLDHLTKMKSVIADRILEMVSDEGLFTTPVLGFIRKLRLKCMQRLGGTYNIEFPKFNYLVITRGDFRMAIHVLPYGALPFDTAIYTDVVNHLGNVVKQDARFQPLITHTDMPVNDVFIYDVSSNASQSQCDLAAVYITELVRSTISPLERDMNDVNEVNDMVARARDIIGRNTQNPALMDKTKQIMSEIHKLWNPAMEYDLMNDTTSDYNTKLIDEMYIRVDYGDTPVALFIGVPYDIKSTPTPELHKYCEKILPAALYEDRSRITNTHIVPVGPNSSMDDLMVLIDNTWAVVRDAHTTEAANKVVADMPKPSKEVNMCSLALLKAIYGNLPADMGLIYSLNNGEHTSMPYAVVEYNHSHFLVMHPLVDTIPSDTDAYRTLATSTMIEWHQQDHPAYLATKKYALDNTIEANDAYGESIVPLTTNMDISQMANVSRYIWNMIKGVFRIDSDVTPTDTGMAAEVLKESIDGLSDAVKEMGDAITDSVSEVSKSISSTVGNLKLATKIGVALDGETIAGKKLTVTQLHHRSLGVLVTYDDRKSSILIICHNGELTDSDSNHMDAITDDHFIQELKSQGIRLPRDFKVTMDKVDAYLAPYQLVYHLVFSPGTDDVSTIAELKEHISGIIAYDSSDSPTEDTEVLEVEESPTLDLMDDTTTVESTPSPNNLDDEDLPLFDTTDNTPVEMTDTSVDIPTIVESPMPMPTQAPPVPSDPKPSVPVDTPAPTGGFGNRIDISAKFNTRKVNQRAIGLKNRTLQGYLEAIRNSIAINSEGFDIHDTIEFKAHILNKRIHAGMWDEGGSFMDTGYCCIITDVHGNPLPPLVCRSDKSITNGQHALVTIEKGHHVILGTRYQDRMVLTIYRITDIADFDPHGPQVTTQVTMRLVTCYYDKVFYTYMPYYSDDATPILDATALEDPSYSWMHVLHRAVQAAAVRLSSESHTPAYVRVFTPKNVRRRDINDIQRICKETTPLVYTGEVPFHIFVNECRSIGDKRLRTVVYTILSAAGDDIRCRYFGVKIDASTGNIHSVPLVYDSGIISSGFTFIDNPSVCVSLDEIKAEVAGKGTYIAASNCVGYANAD